MSTDKSIESVEMDISETKDAQIPPVLIGLTPLTAEHRQILDAFDERIEILTPFFGLPTRRSNHLSFDDLKVATDSADLPDVYVGKNTYMSHITTKRIQDILAAQPQQVFPNTCITSVNVVKDVKFTHGFYNRAEGKRAVGMCMMGIADSIVQKLGPLAAGASIQYRDASFILTDDHMDKWYLGQYKAVIKIANQEQITLTTNMF